MNNNSQPVTIPNFNGGISDRAERLRDLNDFEDVLNCDINLEDGIFKRNPAVYVSALDLDVSANNAFVHTFVRSEDEHYFVVFDGSGVKVFDNSGVERTVVVDSKVQDNYVSSVNVGTAPRDAFLAVTIGDSVLFARKDIVCRKDEALTDPVDASKAYIWFKTASHGYTPYRFYLTESNGTKKYSFLQTAKGIDNTDPQRSSSGWWRDLIETTEGLASYTYLTVMNYGNYQDGGAASTESAYIYWGAPNNPDIRAKKMGSVCKIYSASGGHFQNFEVADGLADLGCVAIWKSVRSLDDLPVTLDEPNLKLRVEGSRSDLSDDYYVKFKPAGYGQLGVMDFDGAITDATDLGSLSHSGIDAYMTDVGYWKETVGFNSTYKYDFDTMPHVLIYRPNGTFLLTRMDGQGLETSGTGAGVSPYNAFEDVLGTGGTTTANVYLDNVYDFAQGDAVIFDNIDNPDDAYYGPFPTEIIEGKTYYIASRNIAAGYVVLANNPDLTGGQVTYTTQAAATGARARMRHAQYSQFRFANREAGDDTSNPWPAFIDTTIKDMVLHRNRLAIISNDAVTLSEFGEFFNFFRVTVQELLDTAPIEVQTTDNTTRELIHAASYKNQLVVFSKEAQFILQGEPALTPESVSFNLATSYDSNRTTKPFVMGDRLYFMETRNNKNRLQELTEVQFKGNFIANDMGAKVPKLIQGKVRTTATNGEDKIAVVSESNLDTIYFLTTKVLGNQRPINAWHRIQFADVEVEGMSFVDNTLYIVGLFEGKHRILYSMEIDTDFTKPFLDSVFDTDQLDTSPTYDPITDTTTYTFPFTITDRDWKAVNKETFAEYTVSGVSGDQIVLDTSTTGHKLYFGRPYESKIVFSKFYPQSRKGQGAVVNDQVVIDAFAVSFDQDNLQTFDLSCINDNGKDYVKTYTTNILDVNNIGSLPNSQDYEEILVQARNRDVRLTISNDTFVPFNLINFEYRISEGRKRH